jgi:hypothetical protein
MFAFLGLVVLTATLQAGAPTPSAAEVLARLDLSTFPNSTRPRSREGGQRPRDYGFVVASGEGDRAVLETAERDWEIGLSIVRAGPEGLEVCFSDIARNDGSYFATTGLILQREGEIYRAAVEHKPVDGCREVRSRSESARP